MTRAYCADCAGFVRGSYSEHVWSKKHQATIAGSVVRRRSPRSVARAAKRRLMSLEPWSLDDPAPTHKLCAGIPSMGLDSHLEPLEAFASNVAYPDGLYVRCRSCHRYYGLVYRAARAERQAAA